jgi:hypothetical protein
LILPIFVRPVVTGAIRIIAFAHHIGIDRFAGIKQAAG